MSSNVIDPRVQRWQGPPSDGSGLNPPGGSGTSGDMGTPNERIARLEGGIDTLKWSVAVVSAALIGLVAVVLVLQTVTLTQVSSLSNKVDTLPEQINRNLLELNRTISGAITATQARQAPAQQPTVIVVPSEHMLMKYPPQPPAEAPKP